MWLTREDLNDTHIGKPCVVMFLREGHAPEYHLVNSMAADTPNMIDKMKISKNADEVFYKFI